MWQRIKNLYHLVIAVFANFWFGFPSKNIFVIGVTGTDGKTTTASLIYHILSSSGEKVALISTIGAYIGDKQYDVGFHVTTPSSFQLQKYIKKAKNSGCKYLVLEVTSHALDQYRVAGIKFDIGVLTNVSHEHLDYHKTYDRYVATKLRLLESAKVAVVNQDDESYEIISKRKTTTQNLITYGIKYKSNVTPKSFPFKTKLFGEFNKYNCLAGIAVCREIGISDNKIRKAIESFQPPQGRQEIVFDRDFKVMIDFAHTPNAFEQLLPSIKKNTQGRLIHVFGAAGERDRSKRPLMGEAASKFDDIIVLTAEDPRSESVEKIINEIASGFVKVQHYKIPDRKRAIEFAISIAQKGDTILLSGKSHEKSINLGQGEEPWDEFEVVRLAIRKRPNIKI